MDSRDLELLQAVGDVIRNEMKDVKDDMKSVKSRLTNIESDMKDVKSRLSNVEHSVAIIEVEHGRKISALYDGYLSLQEKLVKYANLENRVEKLEIDMSAVRMTLKKRNS